MAAEPSDDDIFNESPTSKHQRFFSSSPPKLNTMKRNQESTCKQKSPFFRY
jgi:hypothetical protein